MEKIVKLLDELKEAIQEIPSASYAAANQIDLEAVAVFVAEQINYQKITERLDEESIADYVSNTIEIDHDDLADRIDLEDLSSRLDYRSIDIDHLDLAQRIDFQKVAQNIEAKDVAESINIKDVAEEISDMIDLDDLSDRLDYKLSLEIKDINEAVSFRKNHIKELAGLINTEDVAAQLTTFIDYKKLAKELIGELKIVRKLE
tara:strand:+ start:703 stop:1311 length:609 start_codon:yes stop_codon:yes gene_type:complete